MKKITASKKVNISAFDKPLFVIIVVLLVLGLVAVADASAPQAINTFSDRFYFFKEQLVWAVVGFFLMILLSFVNFRFWEKIASYAFWGSVLLLIAVLVPGIGIKTYGATRWISLGFTTLQPSEIVKLTLIFYMAKLTQNNKNLISFLVPLTIVSVLVMLQPDLGTNMVIAGIGMIQIFASGVNLFHFGAIGVLGISAVSALILVSDYRRDRLITFISQTTDPLGKGYHIRQILLALGSGGLFGVGIGSSRQKFLFLPEAATDSIFAVIAEEIGFVGSTFIIMLFVFLVTRAFLISFQATDKFSKSLALGISAWLSLQIFINLASMTALVPLTGIPLPFFSFGGTSLVMIMASAGILLSISRQRVKNVKKRK